MKWKTCVVEIIESEGRKKLINTNCSLTAAKRSRLTHQSSQKSRLAIVNGFEITTLPLQHLFWLKTFLKINTIHILISVLVKLLEVVSFRLQNIFHYKLFWSSKILFLCLCLAAVWFCGLVLPGGAFQLECIFSSEHKAQASRKLYLNWVYGALLRLYNSSTNYIPTQKCNKILTL